MPTWRQGIAVGEWRQISGSALSLAPMAVVTGGNTGPESKVIAWNSFVIDTRESAVYCVAAGGHSDYAGNEVNRIRLLDNAPAWTEPRSATPNSKILVNASYYADGRPTSRHTYYGATFNEVRGRAMVFGGARWGDGWPFPTFDGFSIATNDWDPAGTYPDATQDYVNATGSAVIEIKSTGDIYAIASNSVTRWSNASNTWTKLLSNTNAGGLYAASAHDSTRDRILIAGGLGNDHAVYDIKNNTMQTITFSGPNASAMKGEEYGMVYDPGLDAYLVRKEGAGATVYRVNAQTFSVDILPVSGGTQVPATINGVYKRFLYVPQLKGIVYFPSYTGGMWFLRTS